MKNKISLLLLFIILITLYNKEMLIVIILFFVSQNINLIINITTTKFCYMNH